jgi:hypothetical protein
MMATNRELSASNSRRGPGRRFTKGTSGNPNGRPKVVFEIRDLARQFGPAAIAKLAEMAGLTPATPAETEATQVAALKELLDRGYGKATQPLSSEDATSPVLLHLAAAQAMGAALGQREQRTIDGYATPTNGKADPTAGVNLLQQPAPLE